MKSNVKELLNPSIAIGKGKVDSGMLALSLQDVFSESLKASGSSLKTSCPPAGEAGQSDIGQEKVAQLKGKISEKHIQLS